MMYTEHDVHGSTAWSCQQTVLLYVAQWWNRGATKEFWLKKWNSVLWVKTSFIDKYIPFYEGSNNLYCLKKNWGSIFKPFKVLILEKL